MINENMFANRWTFNEFTASLRKLCEVADDKTCLVQLRNGRVLAVTYKPEDPENYTDNMFHTLDWKMVWDVDGSSITSEDFDIVANGVDIGKA